MNVIGNRCTAQTIFYKLHRRGRTLFAHTHLTAIRDNRCRCITQSIHTNETIALILHYSAKKEVRKKLSDFFSLRQNQRTTAP